MSELPAEAVEVARFVSPRCDVCGVEYVEDYRGPCQEPRPPYDGSRTCPGTVDVYLKDRLQAAAPSIRSQAIAELRERLLSDGAVVAGARKCHPLYSSYKKEAQMAANWDALQTISAALAAAQRGDGHGD